jgi:hypothetical protein
MDGERWRRAREWFERGERLSAREWEAELRARESDPDVIAQAIALRRADEQIQGATGLEAAAPDLIQCFADENAKAQLDRLAGRAVGGWRLVRLLGQGGMGTVWLAEREADGFVQRAALKLMRDSLVGADWQRRFRTERRILGALDHPGIARLIDGGADADGAPYFALEYVDGEPLGAWCDARRLPLPQRIAHFEAACEAVAYAHSRLVVHRDLKPGNLLATAAGQVKLLDFGIAKLLDAEAGDADATSTHAALFTPGYAAPEQRRGEPTGTAADVYALGVLLSELLCGLSPMQDARGAALPIEAEPALPSARLRAASVEDQLAIARLRGTDPARLQRLLRGDLDAIVAQALRPRAADRYASVEALAADLANWRAHRPVAARRGSRRYRAARFLRRHGLATMFAGVALLALVAGASLALWQAREARLQRDAATAQARTAEAALAFLVGVFEQADPTTALGAPLSARELLDRGARQVRTEFEDRPEVRAPLLRALGRAYLGLDATGPGIPLLEEALALQRERGDPDAIARARGDLALARGKSGDLAAELAELRALLEDRAAPLAPSLEAEVRARYATVLFNRSDYAAAEPEFDAALALQRRLGEVSPQLLMAYAALLGATDRAERAATLIEAGLAEARERLPRRHPTVSALIATHARMLGVAGRTKEALELYRESLAIKREVFGEAHDQTLTTMNSYGAMLEMAGEPEAAEAVLREAMRGRRALLGDEHPALAASMHNLARVLNRLERAGEAAPLAQRALELARRHYGEDDIAVAIASATLAQSRLDLGDAAAAVELLREAIRIQEKLAGTDAARLVPLLAQLSWSLERAGSPEPDCGAARRARAIDAAAGGTPDVFAEAMLGSCLVATGRSDEGRAALQAAYRRQRAAGFDSRTPWQRAVLDAHRMHGVGRSD